MICYGVMDPPEPPYILILMSSIQGVAFNVLWVRTLWPSIDLHLIFILTQPTGVDNLMILTITMIVMIIIIMMIIPLQPAGVAYMTSVAPPALTGTAISLMATVTWVVGKAVSLRIVMLLFDRDHDHALIGHLCPIRFVMMIISASWPLSPTGSIHAKSGG